VTLPAFPRWLISVVADLAAATTKLLALAAVRIYQVGSLSIESFGK
jgi:hypothetical protein